ncbi:MAG TPA: YihY/virulence factor BrkB family protein, partial [Ktedonobacterales bacterium]|nr:YihY/virulence factor BrkB family protein [Ktedonobacterales bacterium]
IFNWSAMLAYVFLTSVLPILLTIIAIGGILLGVISPLSRSHLEAGLANGLPGGASGYGGKIVTAATHNLNHSAGAILIIGIVIAVVTGSSLFISLENVFGVIFRLRGRDPVHQRLMALGMMLLYTLLVPIILLASIAPPAILRALAIGSNNPIGAFLWQAAGLGAAFVVAAVLFGAIYVVVPNRPVSLKEAWMGTLAAAALLVFYELVFPIYESNFLHPNNYGAIVGFAVVILAFFYYLAFILLLGAEVNSWVSGQRQTAGPIDAILHEVQAHDTTRGVAGPTAGTPREDLQDRKGAAMVNTPAALHQERKEHRGDQQPPKYAESGVTSHGYNVEGDQKAAQLGNLDSWPRRDPTEDTQIAAASAVHTGEIVNTPQLLRLRAEVDAAPRLDRRAKVAIAGVVAASVLAVALALRFMAHLLSGDEGSSRRAMD